MAEMRVQRQNTNEKKKKTTKKKKKVRQKEAKNDKTENRGKGGQKKKHLFTTSTYIYTSKQKEKPSARFFHYSFLKCKGVHNWEDAAKKKKEKEELGLELAALWCLKAAIIRLFV